MRRTAAAAVMSCAISHVATTAMGAERRAPSLGDLLIAATPGASAVFAPEPGGGVMHIGSGMICPRGTEGMVLDRLTIFDSEGVGDDVACLYDFGNGSLTLYAEPADTRPLAEAVAQAVQETRRVFPSAQPSPNTRVVAAEGRPPPLAASATFETRGRKILTQLWMADEKGWRLKVRATYPEQDRATAEPLAASAITAAQASVQLPPE